MNNVFSVCSLPSYVPLTIKKELQHFLDLQLEKIPPRAQEVFSLSRKKHLTYKEIAEQLIFPKNSPETDSECA